MGNQEYTRQSAGLWLVVIFFSLVLLAGCDPGREDSYPETLLVQGDRLNVLNPWASLEAVLNALNAYYHLNLSTDSVSWNEKDLTPNEVDTSRVIEYTDGYWRAAVVYRLVNAERTEFRITVSNDQGFLWQGRVNAYGEVIETGFREAVSKPKESE